MSNISVIIQSKHHVSLHVLFIGVSLKRSSMVSVSRIGSENGRKNGANLCLKQIDQIILLSLLHMREL
jgi:hypothetical protein